MNNNFGEFLKRRRKEKNLTQKALAEKLFVTESTVSKWEKNVARPDISLLTELSGILDVTEHELITASIDEKSRNEKLQAKKWRAFSLSLNIIFYVLYGVTLITCFICNLATAGTLNWFWVVFSALALAFTFTNLPLIIKRHRLLLVPLSELAALLVLLAVCCIYTDGNWFYVAYLSVLLGFVIVFTPIYLSKLAFFTALKKYADFVTVAVVFFFLNILLVTINLYTDGRWYLSVALPTTCVTYLTINLFLCVKFIKTDRFFKTSIILFLINLIYLLPAFIKVGNPNIQHELDSANVFRADFSVWVSEIPLENNIHCIIFLTILFTAVSFLFAGIVRKIRKRRKLPPKKN